MESVCFPTVVQAVAAPGKTVYAYFSDGKITQFSMADSITSGGVFAQLEDEEFFRNALTVLNGTVAWDVSGTFDPTACIDIDPFTVYEAPRVPDPLEDVA